MSKRDTGRGNTENHNLVPGFIEIFFYVQHHSQGLIKNHTGNLIKDYEN